LQQREHPPEVQHRYGQAKPQMIWRKNDDILSRKNEDTEVTRQDIEDNEQSQEENDLEDHPGSVDPI
jgi:hypothetical protein